MESAFLWLNTIFETVINFIPHITVVPTTHAGVCFVRGKHVKEVNAGLIVWWPFWTEMYTYPIVRQTMDIPPQTLTTKDGFSIQIDTMVVYTVDDIVKALTEQYDLEETIRDFTQAAVKEVILQRTFVSIITNSADLDVTLQQTLQPYLTDFGVNICKVTLTDIAKTKVITVAGGSGYIFDEEE